MRWLSILIAVIAVAGLAACNTPSGSNLTPAQLKESGTGVVVLSAVAGHGWCVRTDVEFGQYDVGAGGWRVTRTGTFMKQGDRSDYPVGFTFQEGRYGILTMSCGDSYSLNRYRAKDLQKGKLFAESVYETPLAVFDVRRGEAVVIGRIEARSATRTTFHAVVSPLPAEALQAFKVRNPGLAPTLVSRTMVPVKPSPGPERR